VGRESNDVLDHQGRVSQGLGFWRVVLLVALAAVFYVAPTRVEAKPTAAAIIVDADSGAILYESNAKTRTYPASLTKMMTLYLLFEAVEAKRFKLDDMLKVSAHAAKQPATDLGLAKGQQITVEKAILALVVRSANDVAVVIAEALGGTESQFAAMMTKKARELGMTSTKFRNASGLPNPGQVTTARDMAILSRALITRFPDFYSYFSAHSFTHRGRVYTSHNRVLLSYPGADGLKTGYIRASGFNLATSATRDGRRLVAVVLGGRSARSRDLKMIDLLDQGFALAAKTPSTQVAGMLPASPTKSRAKAADSVALATALIPPTKPETVQADPVAELIQAETIQVASLEPIGTPAEEDAKAAEVGVPEPSGKRVWGIQVGAFNSYEPALKAANRASKKVASLVKSAQVVVDETAKGKTTLYRARLIGLSKKNAQAACKKLKAKAIDCLVFQTDVTLAMNVAQ
jgi:D-alanyl-D-alanine carboxypeptidase